jgi:hypothetical protein
MDLSWHGRVDLAERFLARTSRLSADNGDSSSRFAPAQQIMVVLHFHRSQGYYLRQYDG